MQLYVIKLRVSLLCSACIFLWQWNCNVSFCRVDIFLMSVAGTRLYHQISLLFDEFSQFSSLLFNFDLLLISKIQQSLFCSVFNMYWWNQMESTPLASSTAGCSGDTRFKLISNSKVFCSAGFNGAMAPSHRRKTSSENYVSFTNYYNSLRKLLSSQEHTQWKYSIPIFKFNLGQ